MQTLYVVSYCGCFSCNPSALSLSRFSEAPYLARPFVGEPDDQPAVRLPLYVPQLEMKRQAAVFSWPRTEWLRLRNEYFLHL